MRFVVNNGALGGTLVNFYFQADGGIGNQNIGRISHNGLVGKFHGCLSM